MDDKICQRKCIIQIEVTYGRRLYVVYCVVLDEMHDVMTS